MILLGVDVLLDVALDRRPHVESSAGLLDFFEGRPRTAVIAWHTLSNFYYLVSSRRGAEDARQFLVDLTRFVSIAPTDPKAFRDAAFLPVPDFEDALQVAAAQACDASVIATWKVENFRESPVQARTPAELLLELL